MARLTRRAEVDGIKAVCYGKNEVFLEGEPGYAGADKLAHYEDLEESGRLVVLPSGVTGKQLCKIVNACPSILGLKNNCGSHSCESCWEAALRGEEEC